MRCYAVRVSVPREVSPAVGGALAELKERLAVRFPGRVRELRLFGSMARGEAHEHSDVDVLVVLDDVRGHDERIAPMEIAADVGLPRGLVIQPVVFSEEEVAFQRRLETGLAEAWDREGIVL
jgi:uncharacterized protein